MITEWQIIISRRPHPISFIKSYVASHADKATLIWRITKMHGQKVRKIKHSVSAKELV